MWGCCDVEMWWSGEVVKEWKSDVAVLYLYWKARSQKPVADSL